jgi:GxxExxY protein
VSQTSAVEVRGADVSSSTYDTNNPEEVTVGNANSFEDNRADLVRGQLPNRRSVMFEGKHSDLTERIIKAFYKVHSVLGYGFNEKVYENALVIELRKPGVLAEAQKQIQVYYQGNLVGEYFADIVVNQCIIVELKAARALAEEHEAQLLNYLKATPIEVGLLLNSDPRRKSSERSMTMT